MWIQVSESKTLWEKEKLLVTSNFCFSLNVFKSCLLLICQTEYLWSKGLILYSYGISKGLRIKSSNSFLFVDIEYLSQAMPICQCHDIVFFPLLAV